MDGEGIRGKWSDEPGGARKDLDNNVLRFYESFCKGTFAVPWLFLARYG